MKPVRSTLIALVFGLVSVPVMAPPAWAQASANLDAFVTTANRIPQNPSAMLRSDTRRLMREAEAAIGTVKGEITSARAAGRTPPACPPERISVNPQQLLGYLNGIPSERRRRMSVTDGFRSWMASRYPC
jgi:hypothetical protein